MHLINVVIQVSLLKIVINIQNSNPQRKLGYKITVQAFKRVTVKPRQPKRNANSQNKKKNVKFCLYFSKRDRLNVTVV